MTIKRLRVFEPAHYQLNSRTASPQATVYTMSEPQHQPDAVITAYRERLFGEMNFIGRVITSRHAPILKIEDYGRGKE